MILAVYHILPDYKERSLLQCEDISEKMFRIENVQILLQRIRALTNVRIFQAEINNYKRIE
jgi:hypothetical protein